MLKSLTLMLVASQLLGPGNVLWQHSQAFVSTGCVLDQAGGVCKLIPAGQNIKIGITGIAKAASSYCALAGDDLATIDGALEIAGLPTVGLDMPSIGSKDSVVPQAEQMIDSTLGGAIVGICNTVVSAGPNKGLFEPCAVNGDCSSGTCNTTRRTWTDTQRRKVGMYLVCTAGSSAQIRLEQIYDVQ